LRWRRNGADLRAATLGCERILVNLGRRLCELQELDLRIEKTSETLSRVDHQLNHNEALEKAKSDLEAIQKDQAALQQKQRDAEHAVDDIQAKVKPIQQKLFAGSVSNPKELGAMQQQANQLKKNIREEEDKVLEMMGQAEALQSTAAARAADVNKIEREWADKRTQLQAEQADLMAALESDRKMKDEILSQIEPAHLQLYEKLRRQKQGNAVAKIAQGRCQGCKITIPVSELSQARAGELVQCGSCSRVLCVP
jgi:predicted  nucleic acid-binding Zn-ribbon protein